MIEKKCPNCGKPLPESAHFCPFCEKSLVEKQEAEQLKKLPGRLKRLIFILCAAAIIAAVSLMIFLNLRPTRGRAEVVYSYHGQRYQLVLRGTVDEHHTSAPQETIEKKILAGRKGAVPSQLYVFDADTGKNVKAEFQELVERVDVALKAVTKGEMPELGTPVDHPGFPNALYETDVVFNEGVRDNLIVWTLTMKNGQKIELSQLLKIQVLATRTIDYRTTKLETMEDLAAQIMEIDKNEDMDTVVTIILGPYRYTGNLEISQHAVNLSGSRITDAQTVIDGTLTIRTRYPFACEITDIAFEGDAGIGLIDCAGTFATSCTFSGLDIGFMVSEGGYGMPSDCTFSDCRTGFSFNCRESDSKRPLFDGNHFIGNETAILLENVPGEDILMFDGCVFEGNQTDIDNRTSHILETDGASF